MYSSYCKYQVVFSLLISLISTLQLFAPEVSGGSDQFSNNRADYQSDSSFNDDTKNIFKQYQVTDELNNENINSVQIPHPQSTVRSLHDLPDELLFLIAGKIGNPCDLINFSCSSRSLNSIACEQCSYFRTDPEDPAFIGASINSEILDLLMGKGERAFGRDGRFSPLRSISSGSTFYTIEIPSKDQIYRMIMIRPLKLENSVRHMATATLQLVRDGNSSRIRMVKLIAVLFSAPSKYEYGVYSTWTSLRRHSPTGFLKFLEPVYSTELTDPKEVQSKEGEFHGWICEFDFLRQVDLKGVIQMGSHTNMVTIVRKIMKNSLLNLKTAKDRLGFVFGGITSKSFACSYLQGSNCVFSPLNHLLDPLETRPRFETYSAVVNDPDYDTDAMDLLLVFVQMFSEIRVSSNNILEDNPLLVEAFTDLIWQRIHRLPPHQINKYFFTGILRFISESRARMPRLPEKFTVTQLLEHPFFHIM